MTWRTCALHRLDAVLPVLELAGRYPAILEDETVGPAARALFADAQAMLTAHCRREMAHRPRGHRFWPANAEGDDIILFRDDTRQNPTCDAP